MAFRFRLESVLTYRRNLEELAQQDLAKEISLLNKLSNDLVIFNEQRLQIIADLTRMQQEGAEGNMLLFYSDCLQGKDFQIAAQHQKIEEQKKEVEKVRAVLAKKVQERQIIDKTREKALQQYKKEELLKEQNENDEQAILRFERE
jgi:flagellar protein FliJ